MADVFAPQPVKTKVAGDVVINVNTGQTIGLSAGAAVVGKFGIDQTTPGTTNAVAVTNASLPVTGAFFQATQPVSFGLQFTTVDSGHLTSASLAAGATVVLDGAQITAGTGKLYEATVASSVALKAQLGTFDGTTFVVKRTFFIPANAVFEYVPTRYDAITLPTGATAKFRWSITNNDNANAADVYASITHAI